MSYINNFSQNIVIDANNSTNTPINAGLFWAGVATSTLGIAGIQLSLKTDQNAIIYVDQSPGVSAGVGTATITGTNTLNGTSTKFTRDLKIGDVIVFDPSGTPQSLTITSITSDILAGVSTATNIGVAKSFNQYYWDISDSYSYYSAINNFGVTVQAINSYLRIRIKNTSGTNQTYLRLQTALCPIVDSVPRSLDSFGNFKTTVNTITDTYGFDIENTPQGEMRTISPVRLVGVGFEGNTIDPSFWVTIPVNGGTATQLSGRMDLLTNTSANGAITLYSVRRARYVIGSANMFRLQGRVGDTGTVNNTRQWGAGLGSNYTFTISSASVIAGDVYTDISGIQYTILITGTVTTATVFATGTPTAGARTYTRVSGGGAATLTGSGFAVNNAITDGYYFQLSGTTFSVVTSIGGTPSVVSSGSFNGDLGDTYIPTTNMVTWEIYYNTKTVWFVIDGVVLHTVSNSLTPLSNTQSLFCFASNINSGGSTTNAAFYTRSVSIRRLGLLDTETTYKYITTATTTILKYGPGRLKKVIIGDTNLNAGLFTLYDGLSAQSPIICDIDIPKQAAATPVSMDFDCPFHNGLTVVNAVACKVTVIYE